MMRIKILARVKSIRIIRIKVHPMKNMMKKVKVKYNKTNVILRHQMNKKNNQVKSDEDY